MIILKLASLFLAGVALLSIWSDKNRELIVKLLWSFGVLMIPVVGPLVWLFIGKK